MPTTYPAARMADDFRPLAVRVRRSVQGGRVEVDELVNEGVAACLEALPRYDPKRGGAPAFAYGAARLAMRRFALAARLGLTTAEYRKRPPRTAPPRFVPAAPALAAKEAEERESAARVAAILKALPAEHRRTLLAYLDAGAHEPELARRLGCRPGALKNTTGPYRRALAAAREVGRAR